MLSRAFRSFIRIKAVSFWYFIRKIVQLTSCCVDIYIKWKIQQETHALYILFWKYCVLRCLQTFVRFLVQRKIKEESTYGGLLEVRPSWRHVAVSNYTRTHFLQWYLLSLGMEVTPITLRHSLNRGKKTTKACVSRGILLLLCNLCAVPWIWTKVNGVYLYPTWGSCERLLRNWSVICLLYKMNKELFKFCKFEPFV